MSTRVKGVPIKSMGRTLPFPMHGSRSELYEAGKAFGKPAPEKRTPPGKLYPPGPTRCSSFWRRRRGA
jgi:hypothetical protein